MEQFTPHRVVTYRTRAPRSELRGSSFLGIQSVFVRCTVVKECRLRSLQHQLLHFLSQVSLEATFDSRAVCSYTHQSASHNVHFCISTRVASANCARSRYSTEGEKRDNISGRNSMAPTIVHNVNSANVGCRQLVV